jgi:hypothetical protein
VDYSKSEKWKEWTHTFQLDLLFEHLGELGKVDKMCINPIEVLLYPDKLKKNGALDHVQTVVGSRGQNRGQGDMQSGQPLSPSFDDRGQELEEVSISMSTVTSPGVHNVGRDIFGQGGYSYGQQTVTLETYNNQGVVEDFVSQYIGHTNNSGIGNNQGRLGDPVSVPGVGNGGTSMQPSVGQQPPVKPVRK